MKIIKNQIRSTSISSYINNDFSHVLLSPTPVKPQPSQLICRHNESKEFHEFLNT